MPQNVSAPLGAGDGQRGFRNDLDQGAFIPECAPTIPSRSTAGGGLGTDFDCDGGCVAHSLRAEGFDASEDRTGRGTPIVPECADPIRAADHKGIRQDGKTGKPYNCIPSVANPLTHRMHKGINTTLDEGQTLTPVAFAENSRAEVRLCGGDGSVSAQLTTGGGKPGQGRPCVASTMAVRRLTPRECERLQGFPDDYTLIPAYAKGSKKEDREEIAQWIMQSDPANWTIERALEWAGHPNGPRYKALGNSMAVNCMEWLGRRIQMVDSV